MDSTYYILQNGGYPFKVVIDHDEDATIVFIYKNIEGSTNYESLPFVSYIPDKIFIGKSIVNAMTEFSGALDDPKWDGNSILLEINSAEKKYVFIGETIYSFTAIENIITFVSPVGNSQVCYPYAIDCEGNSYLMIENVVLFDKQEIYDEDTPYNYYYKNHHLEGFENITNFRIGNENFILSYHPEAEFDFDSMKNRISNDDFHITRSLDSQTQEESIINKDDYIELMQRFQIHKGFRPMQDKILIQDRIF